MHRVRNRWLQRCRQASERGEDNIKRCIDASRRGQKRQREKGGEVEEVVVEVVSLWAACPLLLALLSDTMTYHQMIHH